MSGEHLIFIVDQNSDLLRLEIFYLIPQNNIWQYILYAFNRIEGGDIFNVSLWADSTNLDKDNNCSEIKI
ncbi:MAG: hypothetical protein OXC92_05325 [Flavobacteriaceae bacterium]|nr:hypothetical protein [Flavobacteriaceae bacterium]MCY4216386.1 hypothetical protein [Flavobacteriaceae bacterium]MCY4253832.1 hypothetical protein [Flavobacteriaceae bacterium]